MKNETLPLVTTHKFSSPFAVIPHLLRGMSLLRTLFYLALKEQTVAGKILDIGSKSAANSANNYFSYYSYLNVDPQAECTYTDLKESEGIVYLNVEEPFPFPDESFDAVLAFHLFEHVYNYQVAPKEIFRVLRKGGRVFIAVPFLHEYHADPDDYFRFTDSALRRIWEGAGLECIHIEAIGEGLLTANATKLPSLIMPRWGRAWMTGLLYLITTPLDRLIALRPTINDRTVPVRYALEYFAIFQKPNA